MEKKLLDLNVEPKKIFEFFQLINKIPRGSGNEKALAEFLVKFFTDCGCDHVSIDEFNNVLVRKNANCISLMDSPMITFQAHMDMVNIKTNDSNHDFKTDPIPLYSDGEWISADNTTLGADNGLAIAEIMNVFSNPEIKHGPIEAILTTEEETTMNGATSLKPNLLKGKYLLNLDSESDDTIILGCVGMADVIAKLYYTMEAPEGNFVSCKLTINNCLGGHSGTEIHKWRINAIKEIFCLLAKISETIDIRLIKINGGTFPNAIAESCEVHFSTPKENVDEISNIIEDYRINLKKFYATETNFEVEFDVSNEPTILSVGKNNSVRIIHTINGSFNGLSLFDFRFNVPNTSANIGKIEMEESSIKVQCLVRSPFEFNLDRLSSQLVSSFRSGGFKAIVVNKTVGWVPEPDSNIFAKKFKQIYESTFSKKLKMTVTGGGLETAVILEKYPNMQCVSYGAVMHDIHTAKEKLSISSVKKMHQMIVNLLREIK